MKTRYFIVWPVSSLLPYTAWAETIGQIMDRLNTQVDPSLLTLTAIFYTAGFLALGVAGWNVLKHGKGQAGSYGGGSSLKVATYAGLGGVMLLFMGMLGGTLGESIWGTTDLTQGSSSGINSVVIE